MSTSSSFYVINLYTWLTDKQAVVGLAQRVAEIVGPIAEIDELSTTVSDEEDRAAEPERVYLDVANVDRESVSQAGFR